MANARTTTHAALRPAPQRLAPPANASARPLAAVKNTAAQKEMNAAEMSVPLPLGPSADASVELRAAARAEDAPRAKSAAPRLAHL